MPSCNKITPKVETIEQRFTYSSNVPEPAALAEGFPLIHPGQRRAMASPDRPSTAIAVMSSSSSATGVDVGAENVPPQLSALFLIRFDKKVG